MGMPGYMRWSPGLCLTEEYYYIRSMPVICSEKQIPIAWMKMPGLVLEKLAPADANRAPAA